MAAAATMQELFNNINTFEDLENMLTLAWKAMPYKTGYISLSLT